MIVVAIIGIISAIAYPSYQSYVEKTRRTAAQGKMLELAQWMERAYTTNGSYPTATASLPLALRNIPEAAPFQYEVTLGAGATATSYTLIATAKGSQVGDDCGNLSLSNTGAKSPAQNCWKY
jgi:type IV pilus assembly protein PilE